MLRKKIGKEAPKIPTQSTTTTSVSQISIQTQPIKPQLSGKIQFSKIGNVKQAISKDRVTQLVANKVSKDMLIKDR